METPNDGNLDSAGGQEQPTSAASQAPSQLSKDDIQALVQRLDAAEKQLKGLQKGTDKQIANVRDEVKRILELKEKGLDETQIHRELMIDQLLGNQIAPAAPVAAQPANSNAFDVETVVKAMQFDENDVAVAAVKKAYADNPQVMIAQLAQLKISQAKPTHNPATALPPAGGQAGGGQVSVQVLTANYKNEMLAAPRGPKGDEQRRAIKNKYIQQGVNVHEIDFTK